MSKEQTISDFQIATSGLIADFGKHSPSEYSKLSHSIRKMLNTLQELNSEEYEKYKQQEKRKLIDKSLVFANVAREFMSAKDLEKVEAEVEKRLQ